MEDRPPVANMAGESEQTLTASERQCSLVAEPSSLRHEATAQTPFRADEFAEKHELAKYFPRIDDDDTTSWRMRLSKRNRALLLQIGLIVTTFIVNLFILVYFSSKYPSRAGVGLLFAGDCDTVNNVNRLLHLLINALSTGMLSASNFCMQLQASPTRGDIDREHRRNRWLDIGVPSLRNLRYIGRWRVISCIVLSLSSLPIHLIFNSAVFQSRASNEYMVAVVKNSFLSGASWNLTTARHNAANSPGWDDNPVSGVAPTVSGNMSSESIISVMQTDVMNGLYETKNTSDCYAIYEDYWGVQGNVVVLVENATVADDEDSLLLYTFIAPPYDNWDKNLWAANNGTGTWVAFSPPPPVATWYLGPPRYKAAGCLVQKPPQATAARCRLEYSTDILVAVCVLNFVKLLVLVFVWIHRKTEVRRRRAEREEWDSTADMQGAPKEDVLHTLGDAIASFMREPDETTRGLCLATKDDFVGKNGQRNRNAAPVDRPAPLAARYGFVEKWKWKSWKHGGDRIPAWVSRALPPSARFDSIRKKMMRFRKRRDSQRPALDGHPRAWKKSSNRWMKAVTWRQWLTLLLMYIIFLAALYTSFGMLTASLRHRHFALTLAFFRSLGFGAVSQLTFLNVMLPRGDPAGLLTSVLLANAPQLWFSLMYTVAGAVLTTFLVQREFAAMHVHAHVSATTATATNTAAKEALDHRDHDRRHHKPLRVSEPVGIQRSSYFISLPFRYGVPLTVLSAVFHWLISQSFFLARVTALLPDGTEDYPNSFSTLGYSPYAVLITGAVGFINFLMIVLVGCRKYDGTMSMVSTNSMAISAACHSLPEDREFGYQLPVQWGVVEVGEDGVGHCTFSTAPVNVIREPQEGALYQ
ncbi:hypothetical protein GGR56DRAFT_651447 [Xylariaceae sp. FL0804]|nr:hypothetical protein GGR56DRAFT_651447 [Xylariaceae sp. FL0804]